MMARQPDPLARFRQLYDRRSDLAAEWADADHEFWDEADRLGVAAVRRAGIEWHDRVLSDASLVREILDEHRTAENPGKLAAIVAMHRGRD